MKIWVDADACPGVIREILFRAAVRTETVMTLVANSLLQVPPSPFIHFRKVARGFDAADDRILAEAAPGDLVITADIPLAAEAIERGAQALSPRGELFSPDTIRQLRTMRDFMDTLRGSGIQSGGAAPMRAADRQAFAAKLDTLLTAAARQQ
jgi:uncharacterized protein YaiI (UPF0178 family)